MESWPDREREMRLREAFVLDCYRAMLVVLRYRIAPFVIMRKRFDRRGYLYELESVVKKVVKVCLLF